MIRRTKGQPLLISPFRDVTTTSTWNTDDEIVWQSSTILSTHEKDEALYAMYRDIDRGVDRWIQDARYLPRLIICAITFLVIYFIFSLAVRDPIPMVDELLLAAGGAIGMGVFLTRRDKKSDVAMKRRMEFKQNASRTDFIVQDGLSHYEKYLDDMAFMETIELADRLANVGNGDLPQVELAEEHRGSWQYEVAAALIELVRLTDKHLFGWYLRIKEVREQAKRDITLSARLLKHAMSPQRLDIALLALMITMPKQ